MTCSESCDYKEICCGNEPVIVPQEGSFVLILEGGTKKWSRDGRLHRLDGPAVEWSDGVRWWCIDGRMHRLDGPAVEYNNGRKEYWINNLCFTYRNWQRERKIWIAKEKAQIIKDLVI